MPTPCPYTVQIIDRNEYIGDSLGKINNNFTALASAACDLQQYIDAKINIRTFFYYGPQSTYTPDDNFVTPGDPTSGMDEDNPSYPSNTTIQNFVSGTDGLDLLPISKERDEVYVIYQKTGWFTVQQDYERSGVIRIPYQVATQVPKTRTISISRKKKVIVGYETQFVTRYATYRWSETVKDINLNYSPNFVVYRLIHDGNDYKVDVVNGFPRFVRAQSANTINWNNPKLWTIY